MDCPASRQAARATLIDFPVSQQEFGKMTAAGPDSIKPKIRAVNTD
jgi:hypothetical protein